MTFDQKRKNKPGQGRKPLGQDRGGLVPFMANIFADQAEWLAKHKNQQDVVRGAIDRAMNGKDELKSIKGDKPC